MIVDDEEDIVLSIATSLEHNGYKVTGFTDAKSALESFQKGKYELIIIDIRMPGMDGFELYEKIEEIDKDVKVCFITGFDFNYLALREIYPSVDFGSFIRKPVATEELIKKIKTELA